MNIREVLKLKDGTQVKIVGNDYDIWMVVNGVSLVLQGKGTYIEDKYTLRYILDAEFENYYESLTIKQVLSKERVGHIIKMLGDNPTVYRVIECNGKFDLEIIGSPMRVSDEYFLSEVLNSRYVDFGDCEEDSLNEEEI